jgi:hypothetical protein
MKKLLIVLLALGMVLGFSMSAAATDVSVSGSYRIVGWYDNNSSLNEVNTANAFYRQRLRVSTVFQVAEGLKLTTRFDALEQRWGQGLPATQNSPAVNGVTPGYSNDSGSVSFEQTQLDFTTPYGAITAGILDTNTWGLDFGNNSFKVGRLVWKAPVGPVIAIAGLEKDYEGDAKPINQDSYADADGDAYILAAVLKQEGLEGGLLWKYVDYAQYRALDAGSLPWDYQLTANVLSPYVKATVGPAYVEAQLYYAWGTLESEISGPPDIDVTGMSFIVEGKMDVGPGYVGGLLAYSQGDDPATTDEIEGSFVNGGWDWSPCLVLFNDELNYRAGGSLGHDTVGVGNTDGQMKNAWLYQIYAGMSPMEKLTIKGSLTFAVLDEDKIGGETYDDEIGHEVDLQAAYKVFDNLEYSVGFGYFWAGDFYKGDKSNPTNIDDEYLLVHKLQLTF